MEDQAVSSHVCPRVAAVCLVHQLACLPPAQPGHGPCQQNRAAAGTAHAPFSACTTRTHLLHITDHVSLTDCAVSGRASLIHGLLL